MKAMARFWTAALFLGIFHVSTAAAIDGGDSLRGEDLMRTRCKVCHSEGGQGGKLTPLSKTMDQWDRFFRRDKHEVDPKVFAEYTKKDLLDINQYLYDHAADSDQPQTCGR